MSDPSESRSFCRGNAVVHQAFGATVSADRRTGKVSVRYFVGQGKAVQVEMPRSLARQTGAEVSRLAHPSHGLARKSASDPESSES